MAGYTTNLPVNGAFNITAVYGQIGKYWKNGHKGIDITAALKSIYCVCDGTVSVVGFDEGGWGRYVSVKPDGFERIRIIFCHLEKDSVKVKKGDKVSRKTVLGTMGTTGNSTGVHLHLEMRIDNESVDITPYLLIPNKKANGLNSVNFKFEPKNQKTALDKLQKAFDGTFVSADKTDESKELKNEIERLKKALSDAENRIQNAKKALG